MPAVSRAADPLVGQWHFDTTSPIEGNTLTPDSSGFGRDLQSSTIQLADGGRFGKYLSESNATQLSTASGIPLQRVTLLAWIKKTGDPFQGAIIAGQGEDAVTCNRLSYALYSGGDGGADLYFEIRQPGQSADTVVDSPHYGGATDGKWHLVAGVFDGSSVRLYVDGAQVGSGTPTSTSSIAYASSAAEFGADGYSGGNSCPAGPGFAGGIDELRVYDRALSTTEIGRLAAAQGTTPPVLVPDQPPPHASFSLLKTKVPFLHPDIFDARNTTNAKYLFWEIKGGGHDERLLYPANEPILAIRLPTPGLYKVTLKGVGFNGVVSSSTHSLRISGRTFPPRLIALVNPPVTSVSASNLRNSGHGPVDNEASLLCGVAGEDVTFAAGQARGCFNTIADLANVPPLEQAIARYDYISSELPAPVAVICNQAANGQVPQSKCDEAKQIFGADTLDAYSSHSEVSLNGLVLKAQGPAHVVIFPRAERVICSFCIVTWGSIPVFAGPVDWNLLATLQFNKLSGFSAKLFNFDASKIGDIAGFHPTGSVSLTLRRYGFQFSSEGRVDLSLPNEFSFLGGKPPTAGVKVTATNDSPPVLDHLDLQVPEANFGAVDLTDMRFRFERRGGIDGDMSCQRNEWKAQANIFLSGSTDQGGGTGFRMSPPPSQNGVEFCAGELKSAGAQLTFGGPIPEPEIFPGISLHQINFAIQLHPTLLRGGAGLDVAQLVYVDGTLLAALASPSEPYYLSAADAGNEFAALAGRTFTSATVAVGGDVFMVVPVLGKIRMASGAMMYSYPSYLYAAGDVSVSLSGFAIIGGVSGEFDFGTGKFQLHGYVDGCLGGVAGGACVGADGWLGSRGIAVCLNIDDLHPGAGYRFTDGYFRLWPIDGCKPSRFWEENIHAARDRSAGTAAAGLTVTLAKGEGAKNIELIGSGSAPTVRVTSPDGRMLTISGEHFVRGNNLAGLRHLHGNQTFIGIKGVPGVYRIDPLATSAPITQLLDTRKGYDSNFTAHVVAGKTRQMMLNYDARRPDGQLVAFAEVGHNVFKVLGSSRGGTGRIRFTPAVGPGGPRKIVAMTTIDGSPIPDQTLASYVAPGIVKTGHAGQLRIKRHGSTLNVSWTPAAGAIRYAVVLRLSDGSTRAFKLAPSRLSLKITALPRYLSGTVQVSARGVLGSWASPTSISFKRLVLPLMAQQTKKHNERHP